MNDFVSPFWGPYITVIVIAGILGLVWLLFSQNTVKKQPGEVKDTGHVWDDDLRELNNPLPRWWFGLFVITVVFAFAYLVLYPGLGTYQGSLHYTSVKELAADQAQVDAQAKQIYAKYMQMPIEQVAADPAAHDIGQRLFRNNCAQCHGVDAAGQKGFRVGYPNLTDSDWLGGDGSPEYIRNTILHGRVGMMPPQTQVEPAMRTNVANYVLSLSGAAHDPVKAGLGRDTFKNVCAACHGAEGTGNKDIGAPNLTDKIWLYERSERSIVDAIENGHMNNQMPAHEAILTPEKVQMLTAYVWGLSHRKAVQQ